MVDDILAAAIRVLEREGAQRFTTIRVAAQAGISVGSLYQYFPNKQAILYQLQVAEWTQTSAAIDAIITDRSRSPERRLRDTIRWFFHSECAEAPLRSALDDLGPTFHDAPESRALRERGERHARALMRELAPHASPRRRRLAADVVITAMTAIGKQLSDRRPSRVEVDSWADAVGDMLAGYVASL
jgi:AcrR family transcriptional regulator